MNFAIHCCKLWTCVLCYVNLVISLVSGRLNLLYLSSTRCCSHNALLSLHHNLCLNVNYEKCHSKRCHYIWLSCMHRRRTSVVYICSLCTQCSLQLTRSDGRLQCGRRDYIWPVLLSGRCKQVFRWCKWRPFHNAVEYKLSEVSRMPAQCA